MKPRPIFHITHVKNLPKIIEAGGLLCDRLMTGTLESEVMIGFRNIKRRRLEECRVSCHPGTMVGDYVPFYFCPRSVMLYVISRRNADLEYRGGQREIIHLVSDVSRAATVAEGRPVAFSDGNAGAFYTSYSSDLDRLEQFVDWTAVAATDWRDPAVKERKQAEFLVHESFPWTGIHRVGVYDVAMLERVRRIMGRSTHKPEVSVRGGWYY